MAKCTVIIPCYNKETRLDQAAFASFMTRHPAISFLFVNDGSSDATGDILRSLCADRANAHYLELDRNSGKAEAVRAGMLHAAADPDSGDFIGFWDADLSTSLDEIPVFLEYATPGTLMISGCRLRRLGGEIERTLLRHLLGRCFATAVSNYLNLPVYDTQCGAKLYGRNELREIIASPFVTRWLFDVEILKRLLNRYGREEVLKRCQEVILRKWRDVGGSKLKFFRVLKDFIKLIRS